MLEDLPDPAQDDEAAPMGVGELSSVAGTAATEVCFGWSMSG